MLTKFGEELKAERLSKDITLEQIAAYTRIDIKFLRAMEEGDFSYQPEIYVKAFLKDYAKTLGLDPAETVKRYEAAKTGKQVPEKKTFTEKESEVHEETKSEEPVGKSESRKTRIEEDNTSATYTKSASDYSSEKTKYILFGIGGLVVVLLIVSYFIFFKGSDSEIIVNDNYEDIQQDATTTEAEKFIEEEKAKTDSIANVATPAANDSLRLLIKTSDEVWVQVQKDNGKFEPSTLKSGSEFNIAAKDSFTINIGKAKAVDIFLNNQELEFNPTTNSAIVAITKDGLRIKPKTVKKKANEPAGNPIQN